MVVQKNFTGHRLSYVEMLAEHAVRTGVPVVLRVHADAIDSDEWRTHMGRVAPKTDVLTAQDFGLASIAEDAQRMNVDRILVPDGDQYLLPLLRSGVPLPQGCQLVLLVMRTAGQDASTAKKIAQTWVKRWVRSQARRRSGVVVLELVSSTKASLDKWQVRDPIRLTCDAASVEQLQSDWSLDPDLHWFAVLGALDARKNLPLVLEALATSGVSNCGLLIAGKMPDSVAASIAGQLDRGECSGICVRIVNRLLSDAELDSAVAAVDCVVLAHSNEGPSGLLGKSAAAGTHVVAAGARSLQRDLAERPGLGSWSPLDREQLAASLRQSILRQGLGPPVVAGTPEDFAKAFWVSDR